MAEVFGTYAPEDRRGGPFAPEPQRTDGSVLFADVSGFTALTVKLVSALGRRRGAEEVARHLNRLFDALIKEGACRGGNVIGFSGDAILCWFPGDSGRTAVDAAGAMQRAMAPFEALEVAGLPDERMSLSLKVSVSAGPVTRAVVGDPDVQLMDMVAGETVARIERLNELSSSGDVIVDDVVATSVRGWLETQQVDSGAHRIEPFEGRSAAGADYKVPAISDDVSDLRPWLLPTVRRRLEEGEGEFLTELRPVAALFMRFGGIDYDGDAAAATKLDELVRWVQREVGAVGGSVVQLTIGEKGNYLYAVFGAPASFGDDAHRCAAAAARLRRAATRFSFVSEVQIGLGYGTARTGAYGGSTRRTYGVLGPETNMAARLMGLAPAGTAYASPAFVRACRDGFEFKQVMTVPVKGAPQPIVVSELVGAEGRSTLVNEVAGRGGPFVGREAELAVLSECLMSARFGRGQAVQLTAEAGMGKSQLIAAALEAVGTGDLEVLSGASQPFDGEAPYRVWSTVFSDLLQLDRNTPPSDRGAAVEAAVARIDPHLAPRSPLLAPVLDVVIEENDLVASLGPDLRPASRLDLLISLLRERATSLSGLGRTLVIVLEDVHAVDPLSRELLEALGRLIPDLPLALVTAGRPSASTGERSRAPYLPGATQVLLGPLHPREAEDLIKAQLAAHDAHALPDDMLEQVFDRSDGNPLFLIALLEELLDRAASGLPPGESELPQTLHALTLARLDRLGEQEQASLKVASVIGRQFLVDWLQACRPTRTFQEIAADLQATTRAGVTTLAAEAPLTFGFVNAITHEAAYESLPHYLKTELHGRIAQHVETAVARPDDPHLDELAFHYERSSDIGKRREYLWRAGVAAKANYANETAASYLTRLLDIVEGPDAIEPLLTLGEVEAFRGDHERAEARLEQALRTAITAQDALAQAKASRLLGELRERQGDHTAARDLLEGAVRSLRQLQRQDELVKALLALGGNVLWHLGAYPEATAMLREALAVAAEVSDASARARALHGLANVALYRGKTEEAEDLFRQSLKVRQDAGDELGVANALNNLAVIAANAGRNQEAEDLLRDSLTIRRRLGDVAGTAVALNNLGFMAAERGDLEQAKRLYEQSLTSRTSLGDKLGMAVSLNNLGDAARSSGDRQGARDLYLRSLELTHSIDNRREAATAIVGLAAAAEDPMLALTLCACAESLLESIGAAPDHDVKRTLEEVRNASEQSVDEPARQRALTLAGGLGFGEIVELAVRRVALHDPTANAP